MAKHRASGDDPIDGEGIPVSPDAAYWSVDGSRWPTIRPDLPAYVVDLLAPPIVVGVARVPAAYRLTPPGATTSERAARPTAPRQAVGPHLPTGRHRRALDRQG